MDDVVSTGVVVADEVAAVVLELVNSVGSDSAVDCEVGHALLEADREVLWLGGEPM